MEIALKLIYSVAVMFIMMAPGIILKKCGLSTDGLGKGLSNLVLYIAQPALVFSAYLREFDSQVLLGILYVLIFSLVAHGIFTVVAMMCFKKSPDGVRRMLRFATIFSNAAFMGMPLIESVLGPEQLIYASIYNITFNLFLWSLGVFICTSKRDINADGVDDYKEVSSIKKNENDDKKVKDGSGSILKAIYHPVTIAAIIGLVFFILPINTYVPGLVIESLTMLKNLVAPLSMVVIGLRLADMKFDGVLKDKHMYLFFALRHVILPLIIIAIIKLLSLCGINIEYVVAMVVVILAATPAASSATMFAEKFDCDAQYVSRLVTISTILSIATMPLLLMLV